MDLRIQLSIYVLQIYIIVNRIDIISSETTLIYSSKLTDLSIPRYKLHVIKGEPNNWVPRYEQGTPVTITQLNIDHEWESLAVNAQRNEIYGFNIDQDAISKTTYTHSTDMSQMDEIHDSCSSEVTGLAVDWVAGNLYWADNAFNWIMMSSLEKPDIQTEIVTNNIRDIAGLAVSPKLSFLFWSDTTLRRIERSNLWGGEREVIVSTDIERPLSLVFDENINMLFWLDSQEGTIEKCEPDGGGRKLLTKSSDVYTFQAIAIYEEWVFAVVRNDNRFKVYRGATENSLQPGSIDVTYSENSQNYDIKVLSTKVQQPVASSCDSSCSDLCVGTNYNSNFKCLCPSHKILGQDSKTCIDNPDITTSGYIVHHGSLFCFYDAIEPVRVAAGGRCFQFTGEGHLAVDFPSKQIWLADTNEKRLRLFSSRNELVQENIELTGDIGGISVDWTAKQIYWTNSDRGTISTALQNGKFNTMVIADLSYPTALVVDPIHSLKIYWIERDTPSIWRSNFDGTAKKKLFSASEVSKPEQVTIDHYEQRLYWTDSGTGIVFSCRLDGTDKKTQFGADSSDGIYGVAVFQDLLAWTGRNTKKIYWVLKTDTSKVRSKSLVDKPTDIVSYSEYSQPMTTGACSNKGGCDQLCLPVPASAIRICKCSLGYTSLNNAKCKSELLLENFLLVVDNRRFEIYQINLKSENDIRAIPIPNMIDPVAIEYDNTSNTIYWSDISEQTIWKARLLASGVTVSEVVYREAKPVESAIYGMAGDWSNSILYFADQKKGEISSVSTTTFQKSTIYAGISQLRALAADTTERYIFWSEWGDIPKIERGELDNKVNRKTIVSNALVWPNDIALDTENKMIYWCDAKLNKIESMTYSGANRKVLYEEPGSHFFGIAFYDGSIFLSDHSSRSLKKVTKNENDQFVTTTFGPDEFERASGLKFISTQPGHGYVKPPSKSPRSKEGSGSSNLWIIIGSCLGGIILLIIIITCVAVKYRNRKPPDQQANQEIRQNPDGSYSTSALDRRLAEQLTSPVAVTLPSGPPSDAGTQNYSHQSYGQNQLDPNPRGVHGHRPNSTVLQTDPIYRAPMPANAFSNPNYDGRGSRPSGNYERLQKSSPDYVTAIPHETAGSVYYRPPPSVADVYSGSDPPSYRSTDLTGRRGDYDTPLPRESSYQR